MLVDNESMIMRYVKDVPAIAWDLMELSDKPLTLIYEQPMGLAENVIAEDGSIGIRVTKDEFSQKLIYRLRKPIVSTSANISGEPTPQCFREINPEILNTVDHVVNLRQNEMIKEKPSSIIKINTTGEIKIIRK